MFIPPWLLMPPLVCPAVLVYHTLNFCILCGIYEIGQCSLSSHSILDNIKIPSDALPADTKKNNIFPSQVFEKLAIAVNVGC